MSNDFSKMTPDELNELAEAARAAAAGQRVDLTPSSPAPSAQDPYAVTSWGESEYDFTVPSGQMCRMKKLRPEEMIGSGILDKVTRLPGYAQEQIDKAEGQRPASVDNMPSKEDMEQVIEVLDILIPMVVIKPYVASDPKDGEERVAGVVYCSDIELADRIAIMERSMNGVKKLDNFRQES